MILRSFFRVDRPAFHFPQRVLLKPRRLVIQPRHRILATYGTRASGDFEKLFGAYNEEEEAYEKPVYVEDADADDDDGDFDYGYDEDEGDEGDYEEGGERKSGVVKWFDSKKGFGFIAQDDGSGDVFVHQTNIKSRGYRSLRDGESVEYEVTFSEDGRLSAVDVTGPEGNEPLGSGSDSPFAPADNRSGGTQFSSEPNTEISQSSSGLQVVVHNLPWAVTSEDLQDYFAEFNATFSEIRFDEMGRSRGFGIVRFSSKEDATRAIMSKHNADIGGRSIIVRFDRFG